jgi:HK97 family phage major capsid protein
MLGKDVNPDRCFADFLFHVGIAGNQKLSAQIRSQSQGRIEKHYQAEYTKAAISENSGVTGGYLIPIEFSYGIMETVEEWAIFRPVATVIPMTSNEMILPLPDAGTTPAAAGTAFAFGGILMAFVAPGVTFTETEPLFRAVDLKPSLLGGYAIISNTMLQDGGQVGIEAYLHRLFAHSIAWYEDYYFFRGTGVGQPMGILNSAATLSVTRGAATRFEMVDAAKMAMSLLPHSFLSSCWVISMGITGGVSAISELEQLVDSSGKAAWVPNAGRDDSPQQSLGYLANRPVWPSEKLPALGATGDVLLIDPRLYVIGDRQQITIDASIHPKLTTNQMVWRVSERIDGQPWFSKTITLQDTATVVSPYVQLH